MQNLTAQKIAMQKDFCQFMMNKFAEDPNFHIKIIFTDEVFYKTKT